MPPPTLQSRWNGSMDRAFTSRYVDTYTHTTHDDWRFFPLYRNQHLFGSGRTPNAKVSDTPATARDGYWCFVWTHARNRKTQGATAAKSTGNIGLITIAVGPLYIYTHNLSIIIYLVIPYSYHVR
jgi:hypothetical protein